MTQTLTFTVVARQWDGPDTPRFSVDGGGWLTGAETYNLLTGWLLGPEVAALMADLCSEVAASAAMGAETGFANTTFEIPA